MHALVDKARLIRYCRKYVCAMNQTFKKFIRFLYVVLILVMLVSGFDPLPGMAFQFTTSDPTGHLGLVPPLKTYRNYFARAETDTHRDSKLRHHYWVARSRPSYIHCDAGGRYGRLSPVVSGSGGGGGTDCATPVRVKLRPLDNDSPITMG